MGKFTALAVGVCWCRMREDAILEQEAKNILSRLRAYQDKQLTSADRIDERIKKLRCKKCKKFTLRMAKGLVRYKGKLPCQHPAVCSSCGWTGWVYYRDMGSTALQLISEE